MYSVCLYICSVIYCNYMDLIINSFGATLRRSNGCFVVTTDDENCCVISVDDVERIEMARGTLVTTDAMMLALENDISIVLTEHSGKTVGRVWSGMPNSVSSVRRGQVVFYYTKDAVDWCKGNVIAKVTAQAELLVKWLDGQSEETKKRVERIVSKMHWLCSKVYRVSLKRMSEAATELRGIEGWAARLYFEAMSMMLPPSLQFERRTQHPALDVINACLNYGYSILCRRVEDAALRTGLDTTVGIMHNNKRVSSSYLTYDLMERFRPWVDDVIGILVREDVIRVDCGVVSEDYGVVLSDDTRQAMSYALKLYMDDVCDFGSGRHSRLTEINTFVQNFGLNVRKYETYNLA